MPSDNVSYVRLPHEPVRADNSGAEGNRTSDNVRSVRSERFRRHLRILAECALLSDYWQTATVDAGEYDSGQVGIRPPHFTLDYDIPSLYVGPDWIQP